MEHRNITVRGRVHAVGFRYHTNLQANALGLSGYVKNLENNSVLIEVEGLVKQLDQLVEWCRSGPDAAEVSSVEVSIGPVVGYKNFEIIKSDS